MVASQSETAGALLALSNDLAGAVERVGASVVGVAGRGHVPSSGVHWRQGVIVTADHTIERDDRITIILPDGKTVEASLAGRDPGTDLAVLRLENADLPVAPRSGDDLKVGHITVAVARPGAAGLSASLGAVSAVGGPWRTWAGGQMERFIRPDLILYPGFSGGPLVDAAGQVAGINTSGLARAMALTIPVSTVERVLETLLTKGRIARGYLGLGMQRVSLPEGLTKNLGLGSADGLIVVSVESEGPADRAGTLVGDIIVSLDGRPVASTEDVQSVLGPDRVGTPVAVHLVRGGQPVDLHIEVGERPGRGA